MVATAIEAYAGSREIVLQLRREITPKAPVLKAALRAEEGVFRLKRELQRLTLEDTEQEERREALHAVRYGGKVIDEDRSFGPRRRELSLSRAFGCARHYIACQLSCWRVGSQHRRTPKNLYQQTGFEGADQCAGDKTVLPDQDRQQPTKLPGSR